MNFVLTSDEEVSLSGTQIIPLLLCNYTHIYIYMYKERACVYINIYMYSICTV